MGENMAKQKTQKSQEFLQQNHHNHNDVDDDPPPACLKGRFDNFKGISVKSKDIKWSNDTDFENRLTASLKHWKATNVRGVWFRVELEHSSIVPILAKKKFVFHHAQPTYVMMTRWLPKDEPNQLPGYATNYVGVGGFVLNEKNELLVIQEKFAKKPHWKLPGGHADAGEDLAETAKREVLEETGIETEFVSVICFRHWHNYRHGQSDIYFVCHLKPLTHKIKPCPHEIAASQWMDLDTFESHPAVSTMNRYIVESFRNNLMCKNSLLPRKVNSHDKPGEEHLYYSVHPVQNGFHKTELH